MRLFLICAAVVFALWLPDPTAGGASRAHLPAAPAAGQVVLPGTPGRYGGLQHLRTPLPPRAIALTFDDGPDAVLSGQVLDILDRKGIKATFFMVGEYVQRRPDLVREVVRRGHNVADHSWSHPTNLRHLSQEAQAGQARRGFEALNAALADAPPAERARLEPFFRFPGLGESAFLSDWLADRSIVVVSAEAGTDDWRGYSAATITRRTLAAMEESNGGVLILHETRPQMILALPGLIDELRARGFTFVQITAGPEGRAGAIAAEDPMLKP